MSKVPFCVCLALLLACALALASLTDTPATKKKIQKPIQEFPVRAALWQLHHRDIAYTRVKPNRPKGFYFDFSKSALADPDAGPDWDGYLVSPTRKIIGKTLVCEFEIIASDGVIWNHKSEASNTCDNTPLGLHLFFSGGHYYSQLASDRWWFQDAYVLKNGKGTIEAPLDPDFWSNVWGHKGSETPELTGWFTGSSSRAMWIGLTIGGGCFLGHGGNVTNGTARLKITRLYTR